MVDAACEQCARQSAAQEKLSGDGTIRPIGTRDVYKKFFGCVDELRRSKTYGKISHGEIFEAESFLSQLLFVIDVVIFES